MIRNPAVPHDLEEVYHHGYRHGPKGAVVVYGGQAGSEGKGKIAGYLAQRWQFMAAVCSFGPNAGHTWTSDEGEQVVTHQLPIAAVSENTRFLCLSAGAAIRLDVLQDDIDRLEGQGIAVRSRLKIDPGAVVVEHTRHVRMEEEALTYIASTKQGAGAARADRIMRVQGLALAGGVPMLAPYLADVPVLLNTVMNGGGGVMVECAQGFDLDPYHGFAYPYVTSHGCTPAQAIHDAGIAPQMVTRQVMVIRTYPIRVGNVEGGMSGPMGAPEISFQQITHESGAEEPIREFTTTTKRPRRVFELDPNRLTRASELTRPTDIALTFADYVDASVKGWTTADKQLGFETDEDHRVGFAWPRAVTDTIHKVEHACHRPTAAPRVRLVGTGPRDVEIVDTLPGWTP